MRRITTVATLFVVALGACSGSSEPTATYTGGACDYDGPSEFDVNSTITFTITNESDTTEVGFSIWKFPSGVTPEEIFTEGIFQATGPDDDFRVVDNSPNAIGESQDLRVFFDTPGQWGLNCFDVSTGDDREDDYVTMFTVNE